MFRQMDKISSLLYEFYGSPEGHHIEHNEQWESYYYVSDIGNTIIEHIPPVLLVSKKYGFIKWLVENDKIKDLEEIDYIYGPELVNHQTEIIYTPYSLYNSLLMLLSISDTPIDLLCSLLK